MSTLSKDNSAFTLIELLVVIAIIGILSSVVLASLSGARDSARDQAIKQEMGQMISQGELFYSEAGSYYGSQNSGFSEDSYAECVSDTEGDGTVFRGENGLEPLIDSVYSKSQSAGNRVTCHVSGESSSPTWAFAAPLHDPESGTTGWCVDSSGTSKPINHDFNSGGYISSQCP